MSDYDTQYMAVGDSAEPSRGGGIGWILGILLIIVVIIAVIFLILWLVNRNKNNTGELSITGAQFTTPTSNTIQATWDKVGNDSDVVTMYVYPAGNKVLNFDTNGKPTNPNVIVGNTPSTTTPNTTRVLTVNIPSNASNIVYSAALVVTNPNFAGYNPERGSGLQPGGEINGAFLIRQSGQTVGEVSYAIPGVNISGPTGPTGPVVFYNNNNFTSIDNILFHNDTPGVTGATGAIGGGYLCTVMPSQSGVINIDPTTQCTDIGNSYGLYDTGSGLGIAPMTGATGTSPTLNSNNAYWTFTTDGYWCLSGNRSRCLNLATPPNSDGTSNINIVNNTSATKFSNINFTISSAT